MDLAADGCTTREIATRLGVHRSTVWRQLTDPVNAARLAQLTARRLAAQEQRIAELGDQALDLVEQLLTDETAPPAVRLRAAQLVIDRTLPASSTVRAIVDTGPSEGAVELLKRLVESRDHCEVHDPDDARDHYEARVEHDPRPEPQPEQARAPTGHAAALEVKVHRPRPPPSARSSPPDDMR